MNVPRVHSLRQFPGSAAMAVPLILPLALFGLAGCENGDPNAFAPACAPVGILGDAADYSDYGASESAPDLSKLVSHGSILGVSGHCSSAAKNTLLHTQIQLEMGITRDGQVVTKQSLVAQAQFPANADRVLVRTDPIDFDLAVTRAKPGTSYRIEVGFQLDAAQLAYNRSHLTH